MNKKLTISILIVLAIGAGCGDETVIKPPEKGKKLLTVDFREGRPLRYRFTSDRDIIVDFNPSENSAGQNNPVQLDSSEKLDMIVTYTPVEINTYGLTTVKAVCQSAKVRRDKDTQKDAAEYLTGKTFTFTIDSQGKIHDYSQLDELIKQIGQKAFSPETGQNRIKQPDMIADFIATQWFLWDSISSIENASQGISIGQSWKSKLSIPTPMVSRLARDVTYRLEETRQIGNKSIAVINSYYNPADSVPQSWPIPYTGSFQMRGTFGLLGNYKLLDLNGSGEELFNIDLGRTEEYRQQYEMNIQASIPFGIGGNPVIKIEQTITMKILED